MQLRFTKMHGLGNDFVVIDATHAPVSLSPERVRAIADRHFGVGCDQLLVVEPPARTDVDFRYRIFNADGGEVEQCGNGARCFVRFVHDKGLTDKRSIRVETRSGIIEPRLEDDGLVTVDMGVPQLEAARVPVEQIQANNIAAMEEVNALLTEEQKRRAAALLRIQERRPERREWLRWPGRRHR